MGARAAYLMCTSRFFGRKDQKHFYFASLHGSFFRGGGSLQNVGVQTGNVHPNFTGNKWSSPKKELKSGCAAAPVFKVMHLLILTPSSVLDMHTYIPGATLVGGQGGHLPTQFFKYLRNENKVGTTGWEKSTKL